VPGVEVPRCRLEAERERSGAKDRLHLLRFRKKTYVMHTKAWIFDDELAVVGSANYWARSLSNAILEGVDDDVESEFAVAVASTAKGSIHPDLEFAHELRLRLWQRTQPPPGASLPSS
jgi:phosphatidylserine/phosphatidylglycerophosphate/cardiolipin synthase-like enzyme